MVGAYQAEGARGGGEGLVTPRLRLAILIAATIVWAVNTVLPFVSRYEGEPGLGVAVLGIYGVAFGLPEITRRRGGHIGSSDHDDAGEKQP